MQRAPMQKGREFIKASLDLQKSAEPIAQYVLFGVGNGHRGSLGRRIGYDAKQGEARHRRSSGEPTVGSRFEWQELE